MQLRTETISAQLKSLGAGNLSQCVWLGHGVTLKYDALRLISGKKIIGY